MRDNAVMILPPALLEGWQRRRHETKTHPNRPGNFLAIASQNVAPSAGRFRWIGRRQHVSITTGNSICHLLADVLHLRLAAAGRGDAGQIIRGVAEPFLALGHAEVVALLQDRPGQRHLAERPRAGRFARVPVALAFGCVPGRTPGSRGRGPTPCGPESCWPGTAR